MESINVIKDSLRIINSKYVNSEQIDKESYKITFTYKNRNYELNINKQYKFMMLLTTESIYGMDINEDTLELIEYIKTMISYTEFENNNLFSFSCRKEIANNQIHNILQVIKEIDSFEAIIDSENIKIMSENNDVKIIEYNYGLNTFDKRLFDANIFEDFTLKISTLTEEDLFLIYTTLLSYFYKFINEKWEGELIDPYIINDMLSKVYKEILNRIKNQTYCNWFNEWNNYFTEDNIENYLKEKNKQKNKELK